MMMKLVTSESKQLSLELPNRPDRDHRNSADACVKSVASFQDAKTLAVRRQAVERVISAGIFNISKSRAK